MANASFQAMRKNKMSNFSTAPSFILNKNSSFLRKGAVAGWDVGDRARQGHHR